MGPPSRLDWPPGGKDNADAVLGRVVSYCLGFETQGQRTFSRKLAYGIEALRMGFDREAAMRVQAAARDAQQRLRPNHPVVAAILLVAAEAHVRLGDLVEAEANLRRAASALEGQVGMESVLAYCFTGLASLYRSQNLLGEAHRYQAKAQLVLAPRTSDG